MTRGADESHNIREWEDGLIRSGTKIRPVSRMLFRPEEMDTASRVRPIFCPLAQGDINITTNFSGFMAFNVSVTHYYAHGLTAIQARSVDLNRFPREDPADRQGFKTSLGKPFLLSVDSNTVLGRKVIEGGKGSDQISFGVQPDRKFGVIHQFMEEPFALFRGHGKLPGNLREVGTMATFYKSFHNKMIGSV
jgi:hypothetical protein